MKDAQFSGKYCLMDEEWRSSSVCTALGSIAMLGSETSVIILTVMTTYRVYLISRFVVFKPINSWYSFKYFIIFRPFKKQKSNYIALAVLLAWFLGAALAFLPLSPMLTEYFQSEVWYPTHAFLGKVNKVQLAKFTANVVKYSDRNTHIAQYLM